VLDFIKDSKGNWWFLGCKGFKLDIAILQSRELRLAEEATKPYAEILQQRNEVREERLNSVHCTMCLLMFKNRELRHSLPFKLLMVYKFHTAASGRQN
jgi:hypothetical protein